MMLNIGNSANNTASNSNSVTNNTAVSNAAVSNAAVSNSAASNATNNIASGNISVNSNIDSITGTTAAKNAVEVLKNMLAGDTFAGVISNINGNEIILKMNNGMSFPATLLQNSKLSVGQNLTFMIYDNSNNKISIKPLMINEQQTVLISRALEASNLPYNEKNIQMVKELLNQNMSIDMNTLNSLSKEISKYSDANIDTIVRLNKLEIPITQENINQFEAYKSYEHSISNDMNRLSTNFGDLLLSVLNKNSIDDTANLSQKLLDILYHTNSSNNINNSTNNLNSTNDSLESLSQTSNNNSDVSGNNAEFIGKFISESSRKELAQTMIETFGKNSTEIIVQELKNGTVSAKTLLENMNQLVKDNPGLSKEGLNKLFVSKEFSEIIRMIVRDKMRITPEDVKNPDGIKEYYKRVREDISHLSETASQIDKDSSFSKNVESIKNNIDFMNNLNKDMTYFQMPIKFSSGDADSELYVFTNKKKLSNKTDKLSALLHLDMENLGPLDVFINLTGKNVSTNFCLESEEMLDFVYAHIDQLNNRLESLGYNTIFEMKVRDNKENGINFVEDFLDKNKSIPVTNQLIFDTKA